MTIGRLAAAAALTGLLIAAALPRGAPPRSFAIDRPHEPLRIVSLAPSVTEILFAIGLGDRVVGVTTYCRYPPDATRVPSIGGYLTPNYEALVSVQPDLAILLPEHDDLRAHVEALGIPTLRVDHRGVDGILESFTTIGRRVGAEPQAGSARAALQATLDEVTRTIGSRPRPRVLVSLGRHPDPAGFRSMTASAPGSIYDDLVARAGGSNAIPPGRILYPSLSAESLLRLDPDSIVELVPEAPGAADAAMPWSLLSSLSAVRRGRVAVFTHDYLTVPGPRLVRFVRELARTLHPDAPWPPS